MTPEIRYRRTTKYVNDFARVPATVPEAVFTFTLAEIRALESWVPTGDSFHQEVVDARVELERLQKPTQQDDFEEPDLQIHLPEESPCSPGPWGE